MKLETDSDNIFLFLFLFDLHAANLGTKIRLLKQSINLSESNKAANCKNWMKWLIMFGIIREIIFHNVLKL